MSVIEQRVAGMTNSELVGLQVLTYQPAVRAAITAELARRNEARTIAAIEIAAPPIAVQGEDGKSAYELALRNGFVGTEAQWLQSLKGETGSDALPASPVEIATAIPTANAIVRARADHTLAPGWLPAVTPTDVSSVIESVLATEDLAAFSVVNIFGEVADSTDVPGSFDKIIGIVASAVVSGHIASVTTLGLITNPAWTWTPGSALYLNGTALSATSPSTGFSQQIATAKTAQTIIVSVQPPILL